MKKDTCYQLENSIPEELWRQAAFYYFAYSRRLFFLTNPEMTYNPATSETTIIMPPNHSRSTTPRSITAKSTSDPTKYKGITVASIRLTLDKKLNINLVSAHTKEAAYKVIGDILVEDFIDEVGIEKAAIIARFYDQMSLS